MILDRNQGTAEASLAVPLKAMNSCRSMIKRAYVKIVLGKSIHRCEYFCEYFCEHHITLI